MKLSKLEVERSPRDSTRVRVSVEVRYRSRFARPERLWFELDESLSDRISDLGNPWLVALLPLGLSLKEPIEIELAVRAELIEGLKNVMAIWSHWYPQFSPIRLSAPPAPEHKIDDGRRIGMFFSGGVDSTYSVLDHDDQSAREIDDLIFLRGFDILPGKRSALDEAQSHAAGTARRLGKELVVLSTNARDTRLREANWERLVHGPILCAAGLLLESVYREFLIGSTWPADLSRPFGSHPLTYPHFSTSNTTFSLYAPQVKRSYKVKLISKRPDLHQDLRVCWESGRGGNCGRCSKCLYTMAALEVFGALEGTSAFPSDEIDHARLRSVYLGRKEYYFQDVRDRALEFGRTDIAESMNAALALTARLNRIFLMDRVLPVFVQLRFSSLARRVTDPLRPTAWRVLRGIIRFISNRTASRG